MAIVGAGTMGHAFAMVFLAGGLRVVLHDAEEVALSAAESRIDLGLRAWLGEEAAETACLRLRIEASFADAVRTADIIVEAIAEELKAKQELFERLDRLARPDAVLCTNTSALPVAQVTARVARPERAIGTHWFNPPHLVPGVEVIRTPHTSQETVAFVLNLLEVLGKVPVEVPDVPGFLANRLQMALAKEAILCISEGLATPEELDRLFMNSIGFRLAAAGPLAIADFAGLDVYLSIYRTLAACSPRFEPPDELQALATSGRVGAKSGSGFLNHDDPSAEVDRRNRRLLALVRLREGSDWETDLS